MRLIRLSSNKVSFHTVLFNKKGLSLIVGVKNKPELKESKKTYNGVGKSLLISLINFCLGAQENKEFEEKIPDWEFTLEIEVNELVYIIKRNTSNQNEITVNDIVSSIDEFRLSLGKEVFYLNNKIKFVSFRSLLHRFIRPRKESYSYFNDYDPDERPIQQLTNNGYLLGLDVNRIIHKHTLKEKYDNIKALRKNIKKDEIIKKYLSDDDEVDINIFDAKEKIKILQNNLKSLKVAEDYHKIQEDANKLSYEINSIENQSIMYENAIRNIEKSLQIKSDVDKNDILRMYEEAKLVIPEMVKKKIDDVLEFHFKLLKDREARLTEEKRQFAELLNKTNKKRTNLGALLNTKLQYLDTHGALDELNSLNSQLQDLKLKVEKLTLYKELIEEYDNRISETKIEFENENISTAEYLKEIENLIENNVKIFRNCSKIFYSNKPGGIEVLNNTGINTIRFDIDAKIQDDASDGINEVKIFCFDYTLLKAKHRHNINFIIHDSRLFGNMDSRQLTTLFEIVNNDFVNEDFQYIATLNEKDLESIKKEIDSYDLYNEIIANNIILKLTDESEKTKLLGIEVDMHY